MTEIVERTHQQRLEIVAHRVERAGSGLGYGLWAGFLGALALATVYLGLFAVVLIIVGVGVVLVPMLVSWLHYLSRIFADKASYVLGHRLLAPPVPEVPGTAWQRLRATFTARSTYRIAAWALTMGISGIVTGSLILVVVFGFARELTVPLWWWALPEGTANSALGFPIDTWAQAGSAVATSPVYLAAALWLLPSLCKYQARLCAWVLGCGPVPDTHLHDPITVAPCGDSQPAAAEQAFDPRLERLSPREREVLGLIAGGLDNTAIAEELVVSQAAVLKHIRSIFVKLDLPPGESGHRRVRAVLVYLQVATRSGTAAMTRTRPR